MRLLTLILIIFLFTTGCYYDSEEALFPELPGACDTSLVSYSADIAPLLSDYCLLCHASETAPTLGSNIILDNYNDVLAHAESVLGTIKHEAGFSPMPKGGGKLSSCSLDKYEAWITQGKNDN